MRCIVKETVILSQILNYCSRKRCNKHKCERDGKNITDAKRHAYHRRYF